MREDERAEAYRYAIQQEISRIIDPERLAEYYYYIFKKEKAED